MEVALTPNPNTSVNASIDRTLMERIEAIDLTMPKLKLMDPEEGKGWSKETAILMETRYKRFLYLVVTEPQGSIVPSDFARQLARLGFDVTAVDMSPVAIEQAKKTVAEVGFIEYHLADVERFQPKGRFDLITMKLVFAFLKDKPGMLKRIRKMLKPKRGAFILIAPILVAGETYNEHIATISDHQVELERMLNETFGTVRLYSEQYFGPNGIAAHYLIYP